MNVIEMWLRAALWCGLLGMLCGGALASPRRIDATIDVRRMAFLSETREEPTRPAEETPAALPQDDNRNFDGAWTFTSAECPHTGSLPATITGGKIIIKGGSGQVDPDGTLHSVGARGRHDPDRRRAAVGKPGSGTFNRSDGCVGTWIAIKR